VLRLAEAAEREAARLRAVSLTPTRGVNERLAAAGSAPLRKPTTLEELLRRPELRYPDLARIAGGSWSAAPDPAVGERVEVEAKYAGYITQARAASERAMRLDEVRIPAGLDFAGLAGLRSEMVERLERARPQTLGQASRIPGITAATVDILAVHLRRGRRRRAGS
jgi:tRNA uridine 5-carboxymethylaminomethyl modification enzyme